MPAAGLEPAHPCGLRILSPLRLPFRQAGQALAVMPNARVCDLRPEGPSGQMAAAAYAAKPRAADAARPASEGHEGEAFVRLV